LLAKRFFSALERLLPPSVYRAFTGFAFSVYRGSIRFLYLRFWLWHVLSGNAKGRQKAATVFQVMPYSLVGWRGLEATYEAVLAGQRLEASGHIVECGVAQGGSSALMALTEARAGGCRKVWLFDSYEGLPDPTAEDFHNNQTGGHLRPLPKGSCLGTYEQVSELLFDKLQLSHGNVLLVKGWFQDTLPASRDEIGTISLLRIDADWYESVKCCLENLYDLVVPGGYVIIDDYGSCFGAQRAVDEFLGGRALQVELVPDGRGGCQFVKPR
jgi:O-methyltransferase